MRLSKKCSKGWWKHRWYQTFTLTLVNTEFDACFADSKRALTLVETTPDPADSVVGTTVRTPAPTPPAVSGTTAAGFSSLVWKLSEVYFVTDGQWATPAEPHCSSSGNIYGALLVCTRGGWPEPKSSFLVSGPKKSIWGFRFSVPPHYFPVPSSSTGCLEVKMTPKPSLIMAYLLPNGQLYVVSVFFLSIPSTFLSGSSICCYHMFFSHKYSLSAPDITFCYRSVHSAPSHSNLMTFR